MFIDKNRQNLLFDKVTQLLSKARSEVVRSVNKTMVYTYFEIGRLIIEEEQHGKDRAELLAQIYTEKDVMHITLAEDKNFDINTPPFTSFFVERVLAKMQEKDKEDASKGKIDPEKTVSYDIKRDGNIIKEITIRNLRSERSRELKSSIRWTLEKMYERMKQKN